MIQRLSVDERLPPTFEARHAGVVLVDDVAGTMTVESGPEPLHRLIARLRVTGSGDGEPVSVADPHYVAAVADSIGRQSTWRYTVAVKA